MWLNCGVVCLGMSAVLYRLSLTVADPDLWGHVKFGKDIWQTGKIIQNDPYSYLTAGQVWINHEWLAELGFYMVFALGGAFALILFKTAMSLMIAGIIYRHLFRQGLSPIRAGIVLMLVTFMLIPGLITVRPQMFTYLFFLLLLLAIHGIEHGRTHMLWGGPLLFAIWANLHGGFLAGLGVYLLWSLVHITFLMLQARSRGIPPSLPILALVVAVISSVLATLLNPYGIQLFVFLLRTATVPRPEISEWQPIVIMSLWGAVYLILLAVTLIGLVYSRRESSPARLVIISCAALLPLIALRHGPLFALAIAVLAAEHIGDAWERWSPSRLPSQRFGDGWRLRPWLAGLSLLGAIVLAGLSLPNFRCIRLDPRLGGSYPVRAIALLKQSGVSGNLAVHFDWGEYALWHLSPRIKVSLDGRRETIYSDEIYR